MCGNSTPVQINDSLRSSSSASGQKVPAVAFSQYLPVQRLRSANHASCPIDQLQMGCTEKQGHPSEHTHCVHKHLLYTVSLNGYFDTFSNTTFS